MTEGDYENPTIMGLDGVCYVGFRGDKMNEKIKYSPQPNLVKIILLWSTSILFYLIQLFLTY